MSPVSYRTIGIYEASNYWGPEDLGTLLIRSFWNISFLLKYMYSVLHVHLDAQDYSLLSCGKSDGYIFCVLKIMESETKKRTVFFPPTCEQ